MTESKVDADYPYLPGDKRNISTDVTAGARQYIYVSISEECEGDHRSAVVHLSAARAYDLAVAILAKVDRVRGQDSGITWGKFDASHPSQETCKSDESGLPHPKDLPLDYAFSVVKFVSEQSNEIAKIGRNF